MNEREKDLRAAGLGKPVVNTYSATCCNKPTPKGYFRYRQSHDQQGDQDQDISLDQGRMNPPRHLIPLRQAAHLEIGHFELTNGNSKPRAVVLSWEILAEIGGKRWHVRLFSCGVAQAQPGGPPRPPCRGLTQPEEKKKKRRRQSCSSFDSPALNPTTDTTSATESSFQSRHLATQIKSRIALHKDVGRVGSEQVQLHLI